MYESAPLYTTIRAFRDPRAVIFQATQIVKIVPSNISTRPSPITIRILLLLRTFLEQATTFDLHIYMAYGTIRAGGRRQWQRRPGWQRCIPRCCYGLLHCFSATNVLPTMAILLCSFMLYQDHSVSCSLAILLFLCYVSEKGVPPGQSAPIIHIVCSYLVTLGPL